MNAGQLILEIDRLVSGTIRPVGINRLDGEVIDPRDILRKIEELA